MYHRTVIWLVSVIFIISCGRPISDSQIHGQKYEEQPLLQDEDTTQVRASHIFSGYNITVRGHVRSSDGTPLSRARVTGRLSWCHDSSSGTTRSSGSYSLSFRDAFCERDKASVRVCAEKRGFRSDCISRGFVRDGSTLTMDFRLRPN